MPRGVAGVETSDAGETGARNENGRIEFPICDMRPRAARAVMKARRADANGAGGEGRGPDCAMATRRWPWRTGESAGSDIIFQQFYLASTSQV